MDNSVSEIDDDRFFFSKDGKTDPESELFSTLDAFFSKEIKDNDSSICRFPARYRWLKNELNADDFPSVECGEYNKILKRVDPKSVTLVFPSAHINSPASMFGHTFLRINSSFNSKLLSYAVNYAANANENKENSLSFAIKGLTGGYYGLYSLLPYYDKLKEYRDSEQRDIWEYDLDLTTQETLKMFNHIWELNGTNSFYYFFTENCSYNMLWLIEAARPSLNLRSEFTYHVIPLETVHIANELNIIKSVNYRPSKRTILLRYQELIKKRYTSIPMLLAMSKLNIYDVIDDDSISDIQKKYILEAAVEYLEYKYSKGKVKKDIYLKLFHDITTQRAKLGRGKDINIERPSNPLNSHRGAKVSIGLGNRDGEAHSYFGIRPAYHDLQDTNNGFLRGTQIEFLNLLFSASKEKLQVEEATILSIVSLAQRSEFFPSFSWRTKIGWNQEFVEEAGSFNFSLGAGYSWGNEFAFTYVLVDPIFDFSDEVRAGIGGSIGICIDKYKYMNTNIEATYRVYDNGKKQRAIKAYQGFKISQNMQIVVQYDSKEKYRENSLKNEQTFSTMFKYYF